jgi:hypothetical protein
MSKCEHEKFKYCCISCSPNLFCKEHEKLKTRCVQCGGGSICEHKTRRNTCLICGNISICEHNKRKLRCILCSGSQICEHSKLKSRCKDCDGSELCIHDKRKARCKECNGKEICKHGVNKQTCIPCKGSQTCIHLKLKACCKPCGGSLLCKSTWCHTIKSNKYEGYCVFCFIHLFPDKPITRNYKTKEKYITDKIIEYFPDFTWIADKKVEEGCSKRRPDLLVDLGSHIIIVEIDENKHTNYDCICENKRVMEISQDLGHRPLVFIRFNPDDYVDESRKLIKSCWKLNTLGIMQIIKTREPEWNERLENLKKCIHYWIENSTEKTVEVIELYY